MKRIAFVLCMFSGAIPAFAQGIGNSGTVTGTVTDPSGAAIPGASVEIQNKVTGFDRTASSDATGAFRFLGVPLNNYHLVAK